MTMITPSYLGETIEYSSLHACRSTLEDPTICSTSIVYGAIGPYYFHDGEHRERHLNVYGGTARLQIQYLNNIIFDLTDSYDNYFKNNFQGRLTFKVDFGNQRIPPYKRRCSPCCDYDGMKAIAVQPIYRDEIPVLSDPDCCWDVNWCGCGPCDDPDVDVDSNTADNNQEVGRRNDWRQH